MKRKDPVLPEIKVGMTQQNESIEIKLRERELLDDLNVKQTFRGLKEIDEHLHIINQKRQEILSNDSLSDFGKREAFKKFVSNYEESKTAAYAGGKDQTLKHYFSHVSEAIDNQERRIKESQVREVKNGVRSDIAEEIRRHCANLPDNNSRASFVQQRIKNEDWMTCSALFDDIPAYLLGIDNERQDVLADLHIKKRFPDQAKLNEGYSKIREGLEARVQKFEKLKKDLGIKG